MEDFVTVLLVLVLIVVVVASSVVAYDSGYKNGQIDALNGEIYYELVEQDDKETEWEFIAR